MLIGVMIGAAGLGGIVFLWQLAAGLYRTDLVLMHELSPDRNVAATAIERNCGATTDFSTQVTLSYAAGGVRNEEEVVFIVRGQAGAEVSWLGKTTLGVYCPGVVEHSGDDPRRDRDVFRAEKRWRDTDIRYLTDAEYKASRPRQAIP